MCIFTKQDYHGAEYQEIPSCVTEIESGAFRKRNALREVVIPDSVRVIGDGALPADRPAAALGDVLRSV